MATKAERVKAEAQKTGKARKVAARAAARPAKPHNQSARAGRKAPVRYETQEGRPTRKSTRRSAHHQRAASTLERTAKAAEASPELRARRARVQSLHVRGKRP